MRCDCCNKRLNDYEASLKSAEFEVYMNTCKRCLDGLGIETVGRDDLAPQNTVEDDLADDMVDTQGEWEFQEDIHRLLSDDFVNDGEN